MPIENEELIEKAQELEIDVDDHEDEASLQKAIDEKTEAKKKKEEKDKDPEFWKTEAKSAFESRDKAKKEARTLKNKIKNLEEKLESAVDPDKFDEMQEKLDELLKEKKKIEEEEEAKRLEKADEVEKLKIRSEKEMSAMQKDFSEKMKEFEEKFNKASETLESKDKEIASLRRIRLSNEIRDYASEFKAYNPKQIDKLLSPDFDYDDTLDKFFYPVRDEKGKLTDEKTVKERVKEFLEDPDNDNLVEAEVNKSGTGHKKTDTNKVPDKKPKPGEYDPKDPAIIKAAEEKDMTPERLIEIWNKRDEKFKRIEERKKEERQNKRR